VMLICTAEPCCGGPIIRPAAACACPPHNRQPPLLQAVAALWCWAKLSYTPHERHVQVWLPCRLPRLPARLPTCHLPRRTPPLPPACPPVHLPFCPLHASRAKHVACRRAWPSWPRPLTHS
jgi:hypothetical protein